MTGGPWNARNPARRVPDGVPGRRVREARRASAFGAQRDSVAKLLRKGKKVTVTAVWDGKNVLKVLGPRQEAAPAAEAAESAEG